RFDQLCKSAGAVADLVLFGRVHLAEGLIVPVGNKHRVEAKPPIASWRPDQPAVFFAAKQFNMSVRPGERQHGDEMGAAVLIAKFAMHLLHRERYTPGRPCPAR